MKEVRTIGWEFSMIYSRNLFRSMLMLILLECGVHQQQIRSQPADNQSYLLETKQEPQKVLGDRWVEITSQAQMITQGKQLARAEAIKRALAEAVAEKAGIKILTHTMDYQVEISVNGKVVRDVEAFSLLSNLQSYGRVDEEEVVYEKVVELAGQPYYEVRLRCHVSMEKGDRDPEFLLRVNLNQGSFRNGEEMIITLEATKDCHVTVFNLLPDHTTELLYPNPDVPYDTVRANTPFEIPSAELRNKGIHLRKYVDGDYPQIEHLSVVATKKRIPFPDVEVTDDGVIPYQTAAYLAIQRWLLEIPLKDRREAMIDYLVVP